MQHDGYNEFRQRGRFDFPIEFHHVDCHHPRFYMPYHWHMEYEIDLVVRGTLTLSLNETQIHAQAGDIIFIRDGVSMVAAQRRPTRSTAASSSI